METPWYDLGSLLVDIASAHSMDDPSKLGPRWTLVAQKALFDAKAEIVSALDLKGFTLSQIQQWEVLQKQAAHRRLALYYALVSGNPLGTYPEGLLDRLDPRKQLIESGTLNIAGVPTAPVSGQSDVGGITHGVSTPAMQSARAFNRISGGFGWDRGRW